MLNKIKILYYYFRTKYGFKFKNREELLNWQNKQVIKLLKKIIFLPLFLSLLMRKIIGLFPLMVQKQGFGNWSAR